MDGSALRGNGTNPGRRGASPEGACRVEYRGAAIGHPKVLPGRLGAVSGDQSQVACAGSGLGVVGGAELAQPVGTGMVSRGLRPGRCGSVAGVAVQARTTRHDLVSAG